SVRPPRPARGVGLLAGERDRRVSRQEALEREDQRREEDQRRHQRDEAPGDVLPERHRRAARESKAAAEAPFEHPKNGLRRRRAWEDIRKSGWRRAATS